MAELQQRQMQWYPSTAHDGIESDLQALPQASSALAHLAHRLQAPLAYQHTPSQQALEHVTHRIKAQYPPPGNVSLLSSDIFS